MADKRELPHEIFELASTLLPEIDKIFSSCKLNPVDLFVLAHLKHSGRDYKEGQKVMLRDEMTVLLQEFFKYEPRDVSNIVGKFKENKYLEEIRLSKDEKKMLYGDESGRRDALALGRIGSAKIDEFNGRINELFGLLTGHMSDTKYFVFYTALRKFAGVALNKFHSTRAENGTG